MLHRKNITLVALTMLMAVSSVLAGCAPSPTPTPQIVKETVVVKETVAIKETVAVPMLVTPTTAPIPQEINYLVAEPLDYVRDPQGHFAITGFPVQRHFLDPLVERNEKLEIMPALAASWENPDSNTWIFHLRQGVKFHNGEEFTAESVKATLERVIKPEVGQSFMWVPLTVEVVDKYTAKVVTEQPFGALLANLSMTEMLPPKAIQDMDTFMKKPIGTGPFKVVSLTTDKLELEAFDECWRGAPKIRKVIFQYVQDPSTRVAALLSGEAQIVDRVPYELINVAKASPDVEVKVIPSTEMLYLYLRPTVPPWNDVRARKAIAMGIDRQGIVNTILGVMPLLLQPPLVGPFSAITLICLR